MFNDELMIVINALELLLDETACSSYRHTFTQLADFLIR